MLTILNVSFTQHESGLFNSLFLLLAHPIPLIKFPFFSKKQPAMNFLLFQNIPPYNCHEANIPFLQQLPDLPLQYCWKHRIAQSMKGQYMFRSEEHTSELQSRFDIVCR